MALRIGYEILTIKLFHWLKIPLFTSYCSLSAATTHSDIISKNREIESFVHSVIVCNTLVVNKFLNLSSLFLHLP